MSSLSSTMIIPTHRRTTSTVLGAQPAAQTKALPTPSSLQGTYARPANLSGFWRRPDRPLTPNCCSWLTLDVEEVAEVGVFVFVVVPTLTIPTWCTRMSVTEECALWAETAAPRTAVAAAAATAATAETTAAETETARLRTEIVERGGVATDPAPIRTTNTRITATAAAASTAAPGVVLDQEVVE